MTGDTRLPAIDKELVDKFVLRAHGDFDFVQRTVEQAPQIVNGARDWGGGDWETALGSTPRSAAKKRAKFSHC